jgi:Ca2+-binding RTX toxin-like protein
MSTQTGLPDGQDALDCLPGGGSDGADDPSRDDAWLADYAPDTAEPEPDVVASLVASGATTTTQLGRPQGDLLLLGGTVDDTLSGGAGDDFVDGAGGNDTLRGRAGDDILVGGAGDDMLAGGAGDDMLIGGSGNDRLFGGDGDDDLGGDAGDDVLTGGGGCDIFSFNLVTTPAAGRDVVADFRRGEDLIWVIGDMADWTRLDTNGDWLLTDEDQHVTVAAGNLTLDLAALSSAVVAPAAVLVLGLTELDVGDFLLVDV